MAYTTNTAVKEYLKTTASTDDTLLTTLIARAQAIIDAICNRTFEASANTVRYFDAELDVYGRTLRFFRDGVGKELASINSVTNGDSAVLTSSHYVTEPADAPYYGLTLFRLGTVDWTYTTNPENAIAISGKWAYSESAPADIVHATVRLAAWLYKQKDSAADLDRPVVSPEGVLMTPINLPNDVKAMLRKYVRRQ